MSKLLLWFVLSQAADLATTGVGVHRGCAEVAPMYRHMNYPTIVAVKGGATLTVSLTLGRRQQTKLGKGLLAGIASAGTAAAVWNLTQLPNC